MGLFGDILGTVGDVAGFFSGGGADSDSQKFYRDLIAKAGGLNPNITAAQADPSNQAAAQDAIRELQGIYRNGGLDPIARSQLAEATTAANRNAQANRNAVLEGARARGAGRSGVALALQQAGGQEAMQDANLGASRAAATAEENRRGAIGAAGTLGIQSAAAQDQINRFNAAMRQGAAQQSFENQQAQIGQQGQLYSGVYNPALHNEARTQRFWSGLGRGIGGLGDAAIGAMGGGGTPDWMKNDPTRGAGYT